MVISVPSTAPFRWCPAGATVTAVASRTWSGRSRGAGCAQHFCDVFAETRVEAALAAGIFHRREVAIADVKAACAAAGVEMRTGR